MSVKDWVAHLGKSSLHPDVAQALSEHGIAAPVLIAKDGINASVKVRDFFLRFKDEALFADLSEDVGEGVGVLNGVSMNVGPDDIRPYAGELPYGLTTGDTQSGARAKLGIPARENAIMPFDVWNFGTLMLQVNYDDEDEDNIVIETVYWALRD